MKQPPDIGKDWAMSPADPEGLQDHFETRSLSKAAAR